MLDQLSVGTSRFASFRDGAVSQYKTVVAVDDEPSLLSLLSLQLSKLNCKAELVSSFAELQQRLGRIDADLMILDLSLGKIDAITIFGYLKEAGYRGQIALTSGHSSSIMEHARGIGERMGLPIIGCLRKPFNMAMLRQLLSTPPQSLHHASTGIRALPHSSEILQAALLANQVEFFYQPKMDLKANVVTGAECLARIRHPHHGIIAPAGFLDGASDRNLLDLTYLALKDAVRVAGEAHQQGHALDISVNISGKTISEPALVEHLDEIRRSGPALPSITLELTETDLIGDIEKAEEFATRAALRGFHISIDDFGKGYATFDRLRSIPFNELKLERAIVHNCSRDTGLEALCRAAVMLARSFGAKSVAEGVEHPDDLARVKAMGFDYAQGYAFAKPLPVPAFIDYLANVSTSRVRHRRMA